MSQMQKSGAKFCKLFGCFSARKDKQHAEPDLIDDIAAHPRTNDDEELVVKRIKGADFRKVKQISNKKSFCICVKFAVVSCLM